MSAEPGLQFPQKITIVQMAEKRQRSEELKIQPSMFSSNPVPDVVIQVSEWLKAKIKEAAKSKNTLSRSEKFKSIEIEIEAKLGIIIDKQTRQRVAFPILSETVINNNFKEVLLDLESFPLNQICPYSSIPDLTRF